MTNGQRADLRQVLRDLQFVDSVLRRQRFIGLDQNPGGIRELLYSATATVERVTRGQG